MAYGYWTRYSYVDLDTNIEFVNEEEADEYKAENS